MELNFKIEEDMASLIFMPFGFFDLKKLFVNLKINKVLRVNMSIFDNAETIYIDMDNYQNYFPNPIYLNDIIDKLNTINEDDMAIYKLEIDFGKIKLLYDDDSLIIITGKIQSIDDYENFHNLYNKIFDIYLKSGYLLDL